MHSAASSVLHNSMYWGIYRRAYCREKSILYNNFIQKGGWAYFQEIRIIKLRVWRLSYETLL